MASKCNKTEWTSYTTFPFVVGNSLPKDWILVCKLYKITLMYFNIYNG